MDWTRCRPDRYVVLDTETTGLTSQDRIIELAAVKVICGHIVDKRTQLIQPEIPLPPYITGLTGITPAMLRGRETIAQVLPRFLAFADGIPLVGHNLSFDLGMIMNEAKRVGLKASLVPGVDTLSMARHVLPRFPPTASARWWRRCTSRISPHTAPWRMCMPPRRCTKRCLR